MKTIPTVIASRDGSTAMQLHAFDGIAQIPNRDAYGFYFFVRLDPSGELSRVAAVFSGTSFYAKPEVFGLPDLGTRNKNFMVFAEAALGDYLDEMGLPPFVGPGENAPHVEAFSPRFQAWQDRLPADDTTIEDYLRAQLYWTWRYGGTEVEITSSDVLRLGQPIYTIDRLVRLGEGVEWNVVERSSERIVLTPTQSMLRREKALREGSPPVEARKKESPQPPPPQPAEPAAPEPTVLTYVDDSRIADLRALENAPFDLRKLIAICEELNVCYRSQCYHAVAALTRSILDHIPPIFGKRTFAEVANNHGSRSFKEVMERLERSARKIADSHLHAPIRSKESLPNRTQVNFSNDLDVLLGEVVRLLELGPPRAP